MFSNLQGKKALVTGGSRGIGRAIAVRLAEAGVDVAINYLRQNTKALETARMIEEKGARSLVIKANVAEMNQVDAMFERIANEFGQLDILISNAASGVLKPALELSMRHWHWTMDINAATLIPLTQHFIKIRNPNETGYIVAVSSLGAIRAIPNYTAVGASKAALESIVRHLAAELAPMNVRVNAVSAGVVDTDALKHFPNREQLLEESKRRTPAGRLTTPEDVADAALFLCSDLSRMIHGQTIIVDGGYSILG